MQAAARGEEDAAAAIEEQAAARGEESDPYVHRVL